MKPEYLQTEPTPFKVGDIVVCVRADDSTDKLVVGQMYIIIQTGYVYLNVAILPTLKTVSLTFDSKTPWLFHTSLFKLVEEG